MDIFGIGTRILNSIHEHARMARGTGRSHVLSDMVQEGDAIIFSTVEQAEQFKKLQRTRNRTTDYLPVISPPTRGLHALQDRLAGRKCSRVFYDHMWLEEFYALEMAVTVRRTIGLAKAYSKEELA